MSHRFQIHRAIGFIGFHRDRSRIIEILTLDVPSSIEFVGVTDLRVESVWPQLGENQYSLLPDSETQIDFEFLPVRVEVVCRVCAASLSVVFDKEQFYFEGRGYFVPVTQNGQLFRVGTLRETGERYFYFCDKSVCKQCIIQAAHSS